MEPLQSCNLHFPIELFSQSHHHDNTIKHLVCHLKMYWALAIEHFGRFVKTSKQSKIITHLLNCVLNSLGIVQYNY